MPWNGKTTRRDRKRRGRERKRDDRFWAWLLREKVSISIRVGEKKGNK